LRHQLGLAILDEEEGNLWGGRSTREAFGYDVVGLDELCGRSTPESRLLLDHLPSDVRLVRALVLRLTAAGWHGIHLEVLDHPLQWHSERPLRRDAPADAWSELAGRQLRWEASRAEVEFRYSQALSDLRRELHRLGHGGRGSFFADASVRRSNGPHAALLEALHTDDPGRTTILAEDAELFARAALWISDTLERAHQCGLSLDPPRSARLLLSELDTTPLLARRMALLLAWARRERLLSATEARSPDHAPGLGLSERLRRARRDEALELGLEDLTIPSTDGDTLRPSADDDGGLAPGDYLSLAATGRSEALQEVARRRAEAGDRVLCIVPETGALRGWADVAHRVPDLELMTAAEVAVAILSELVPDAEGACPRPLPPAGSVAGEEIRQGLLKEVSRLYAQRSGRVPALDSRALRRLLEEEGAVERMASAGGDVAVDTEVLRDCIRQARQRHGWLEERDLFAVAAEKMADDQDLAQKWRRHFDCVLVDDAHGLEDAAAELMHRVFMGIPRWTMSDPWLLGSDEAMQPFRKGRAPSRVPRNIAAAMETVARNQPVAGWKFRSARSNGKGELRRERVLNLEACVRHIRDFAGDHDPTETSLGVVLGHENDRRQVMLRLREAGYRVWDADVVSRYAAPGPRELLALGFLVFEKSLDDDQRAGLMDVVLGNTRWDFSDLPRGGGLELEVTGLADCVAAAVHALVDFADAERPLREFCERARNAGLLDTTLSRASSRHRLEDFLTLVGSRPWFDLRHQIDVAALDGSQGGTGAIWCLRPRDLHGRRFDHVFHICTGFEEASRHLLVASRARRSVTALYSETDPYPRNP
jgi:hypothetical protein